MYTSCKQLNQKSAPPSVAQTNRITYIDAAKGIGILLVIIAHHFKETPSLHWWIYSFHMPLFFIISGYLISVFPSEICFKEQVIKSAKSLLYSYCTFSLVIITWHFLFYSLFDATPEESINSVILKSVSTYGYHALWFLPVMFWSRIIVQTIPKTARKIYFIPVLIIGCILSWISNDTTIRYTGIRYFTIYFGRVMIAITFLEIGKYCGVILPKMNLKNKHILFVFSTLVSLLFFKQNPAPSLSFSRINNPILYYLLACAGSVSVILFCDLFRHIPGMSTLTRIGQNSLTLMALHMDISIEISWIIIGVLGITDNLSFRNASICATIVELVILNLFCILINRFLPFMLKPKKQEHSK